MKSGKTILVNRSHPVPAGFSDGITLVSVPDRKNGSVLLESETARAFLALRQYFLNAGLYVGLESGYRTDASQQQIWDEFLLSNGEEYMLQYVAPPGYSEHQTGLAADIELRDGIGEKIADYCGQEFKTFFAHLHEFGFILRYPESREAITGYSYEPWHIRYVGVPAAEVIYRNNWTLEEYCDRCQTSDSAQ